MNENITTIVAVGVIAVASMFLVPTKADTIALASVSGLIGYLTRSAIDKLKSPQQESPK